MASHRLSSRFGLPLLARELLEQAARKRTYVLRVLYASLLFAISYLVFYETWWMSRGSPLAVLGHGREIFSVLVALQFAGIYFFMPAITCGVLTQEKERNSLMLLFLTRLGPWTIVFEKLLSRLIAMLCFLLLSLPLLAFAYSLGGISAEYLWSGVWMLVVAMIQMGTLALACSAWFRTTVAAFVSSYVIALAMFFGPAFAWPVLSWASSPSSSPLLTSLASTGIYEYPGQPLFLFFAPAQFFSGGSGVGDFRILLLRSVPMLLASAVCVVLARVFVVRRAFVPPGNIVLGFFKRLDGLLKRLNDNRITRGIVLLADKSSLPENDPVAWRETTKRSLGRARYLFRIFLAIEIPLAMVCALIAILESGTDLEALSLILFLLWIVATLIVSVSAASLIAGERSHQTLDVLATTPLTGREIVQQKFRGVKRLIVVLLAPFLTLFLFHASWSTGVSSNPGGQWYREFDPTRYLVCSMLSVGIYLPLVAWLSLFIGLRVRSQARAIIGSLGAIVGWCILPFVFIFIPFVILTNRSSDATFLLLLSPATIIPLNEFREIEFICDFPWVAVVFNFLIYGGALLVLRAVCLCYADQYLGRTESE